MLPSSKKIISKLQLILAKLLFGRKKVIGIVQQGRLGNQMFEYAFIKSVSIRYNTHFFIDNINSDFKLFKYFRKPFLFFVKNKLLKRLFFAYPVTQRSGYVECFHHETKYDINFFRNMEFDLPAYFNGFFQSGIYIKKVNLNANRLLKVKKKYLREFYSKYNTLLNSSKIIVAHFRGGDYFQWGNDRLGGTNMTLPIDYFKRCFSEIHNLELYKVIFVSDSPDYLKSHFDSAHFRFEKNTEIIDLLLLMHADIVITSNSSFSWWGAFLNTKAEKIFAPEHWIGFKLQKEYPEGILVGQNWNLVKV